MATPLSAQIKSPVKPETYKSETLMRRAFASNETCLVRVHAAKASQVAFDVSGFLPRIVAVKGGIAEYRFEAALLRAGDYDVRSQPLLNGKPLGNPKTFRISIAPPRNPQRMPVWNWFGGEAPQLQWWKDRGFNGFRLDAVLDPLQPGNGTRNIARILDDSTRMGLDMGAYFYPTLSSRWAAQDQESHRILKLSGTRDPQNPYPLDPGVLDYGRQIAESWTRQFAPYPAWNHVLLSSEYYVPFAVNESAIADAKRELNLDLREIFKAQYSAADAYAIFDVTKFPEQWQPKNGIIEDDNTIYRVLQWWWKRGNGLAPLNANMAKSVKAKRPDVLTWHDPYRLAPVLDTSADKLDIMTTWTYGHPDIKRLSYTTVLQAAARPAHQKVMPTITLFVYKYFVQPIEDSTANMGMDSPGSDPYFTQGPDYARQAMWLNISQRPDMLAFYYGGSLTPDNTTLDPTINSPETFDAIGEVSRELVEPYGPALLQTKRQKARVAVLLSAASIWFNGPKGMEGYANESILPFCSLLMMNHVPFEVIFDDDIAAGRLDDYDALCIPRGDTLRRSDYEKITEFAKAGKTIIATDTLRAEIPGAQIVELNFDFQNALDGTRLAKGTAITADEFRSQNEALAAQLQPLVSQFATSVRADSPRVLLSTLESGKVSYIFAVNDNKTYGPRFGTWKLIHELGVRQPTRLSIPNIRKTDVIYDALSRTQVQAPEGIFETTLAPARGKLYAVLPEKIGTVEITAPKTGTRGRNMPFAVRVVSSSGQPLEGSIPLQIEIRDANGDRHPASRFGATMLIKGNWILEQPLTPALNDEIGNWTIRVTELLSGTTAEAKIAVK